MRIVHVCPWPGPPLGGGTLNIHHLIRELLPNHPASFVLLQQGSGELRGSDELAAAGFPHERFESVTIPQPSLRQRVVGVLERRFPPGGPLLETAVGGELRTRTKGLVDEWGADVVVLWRREFAAVLSSDLIVPKVLYACDSSSMVLRSFSKAATNPVKRWLYADYARRHARFEREFFPRFDRILFIAERDAKAAGLAGNAAVEIVPNGVDCQRFRPSELVDDGDRPLRLEFHGVLDTPPNRDCVAVLESKVGPRLCELLGPDAFELRIVGRYGDHAVFDSLRRQPWARLTGFVDDIAAELRSADVYVAPLRMGGGMKNKVIEAMATGIPVVGTAEAFSGLSVRPGRDVVCCGIDRVADEVAALATDIARRRELAEAARAWVVENAAWSASGRRVEAALEAAVTRVPQRATQEC